MGREGGRHIGWGSGAKEGRLVHIQILKLSGSLKEPVKFLLHHHCPKPAKPITFKSHTFKTNYYLHSISLKLESFTTWYILNLMFPETVLFTNMSAKKKKKKAQSSNEIHLPYKSLNFIFWASICKESHKK